MQSNKSMHKNLSCKVEHKTFLSLVVLCLGLTFFFASCSTKMQLGKKGFNTGLTATYKNMEPEKVFLVMNNEVVNHTDIPLGESFLVVNDGMHGAVVKEGKVMIGCSLKVTDQHGAILLEEKDLFEGQDVFNEAEATMLKCTINTGEPMKWEEKYDIEVVFWDKNGTGKVENKVSVRMIDLP
jgi:hypothetical protein